MAWFVLGICLAIAISWFLQRRECTNSDPDCVLQDEIVRNQICSNVTKNTASLEAKSTPALTAVLFSIAGALLGVFAVILIIGLALHFHEKYHSGSYVRLMRSALLHQTRCHASVPQKRQNWKPLRWQANVFSCKDLRKIFCLDLDMVNIAGVGLTLYRATMVLFLAIAVLCRIGNGVSTRFLLYISTDWCTDRLSAPQAAAVWGIWRKREHLLSCGSTSSSHSCICTICIGKEHVEMNLTGCMRRCQITLPLLLVFQKLQTKKKYWNILKNHCNLSKPRARVV